MFLIYQFIEEYVSNGPAWLGLFFALSSSMLLMSAYYNLHSMHRLYKHCRQAHEPNVDEEDVLAVAPRIHTVL
jgi:hypothetical protein